MIGRNTKDYFKGVGNPVKTVNAGVGVGADADDFSNSFTEEEPDCED